MIEAGLVLHRRVDVWLTDEDLVTVSRGQMRLLSILLDDVINRYRNLVWCREREPLTGRERFVITSHTPVITSVSAKTMEMTGA